MYCKNCGCEIAEDSKFCSQCGTAVTAAEVQANPAPKTEDPEPVTAGPDVTSSPAEDETPAADRSGFADFDWNITGYPDRNSVERTDDIDFNWHADPKDIPEKGSQDIYTGSSAAGGDVLRGEELESAIFGETGASREGGEESVADRIDKFYTFNRKNEEFQQLLDREYSRVKSGNAIEGELTQAESRTDERLQEQTVPSDMDEFLKQEGIVKPYEPKAFESDVLERIEAQEAAKAAKEAEEQARQAAIEEARQQAAAEARAEAEAAAKAEAARLQDIAMKKAAEEAKRIEEERIKAEAEAKAKAEAEEKARIAEEARLKAEAEAKVRAEEARLRAEADLKAAQEAAKIKAQQEARLAAEAERRFNEEQERRRLADIEAKKKLEAERQKISEQANRVVAQEEARKVLEQTARMKEEEAAKIKAAVAGLRADAMTMPDDRVKREVQEAHKATRTQIDEMARARSQYFSEYEDTPSPLGNDDLITGRNTMLSDDSRRTRVIDKKAVLAGMNDDTVVVPPRHQEPEIPEVPEEPEEIIEEMPQTGGISTEDDDFFNSLNAVAVDVPYQDEEEVKPLEFKEEFPEEEPAQDVDSTQRFSHEDFSNVPGDAVENGDTVMIQTRPADDAFAANDFDSYGDEEARNYISQQEQENAAQAMDSFYADEEEEENLSKKELKRRAKEQKRLDKQNAKAAKRGKKADFGDDEEEDKGGKGRVVLKVILGILIVVLAAEIAGMGIKFLAPQSKAAEFIDMQLNKVIQLFTGEDTEYSVIAAQVRTEPMEDKTDLITAQASKNAGGVIGEIKYDASLAFDEERDSEVSDLVLSQPMTLVEWGRDKENYPVYYDEQVVGEIIAFESQRYSLMKDGDEKVLDMIDQESKLYGATKKLKGKAPKGEFKSLEIGEIRQAGSNYYVWVRETIGTAQSEKVYSMYPEKKFTMKMANCYEV